jgi:Flp pilus assembly protein TadD
VDRSASPDHERPQPGGGTYEWFHRGMDLLQRGDAAAAATLLARASQAEPASASVREALARAQFDAGRFEEAAQTFSSLVRDVPDSDYGHFGLGLALSRLGRFELAAEHLALAATMRPDNRHYADRLRQTRATVRARREAGLG